MKKRLIFNASSKHPWRIQEKMFFFGPWVNVAGYKTKNDALEEFEKHGKVVATEDGEIEVDAFKQIIEDALENCSSHEEIGSQVERKYRLHIELNKVIK